MSDEQLATLSDKELMYLEQCLSEIAEQGVSHTAESLAAEDYKSVPVSMEQFLLDDFYAGTLTKEMYPAVRGMLVESFDGTPRANTLLLGGGIGYGKSTAAAFAMLYGAYRLTCLRDPHGYYKLARGSNIYGVIYSVNLDQAIEGIYGKILSWVDAIPYFTTKCPRLKRINSAIRFSGAPIEIIPASRPEHTIGKDVMLAAVDEANFLNAHGGVGGFDVAEAIYNSVQRRIKSRFMQSGGESPGLFVIASSRTSKSSFFEEKVKELRPDIASGTARLYAYAQWEVKPAALYKKPKFSVEIGDRMFPSRILREGDTARAGSHVIHVPGEFRSDFEADVEKALRDLAGVATESLTPLFHDKSIITRCADASHVHPFTRQEVTLDVRDDIGLDAYFQPHSMFRVTRSAYELRLNPQCARYLHVDIGLTGDALGLTMCHVSGHRLVRRARRDGTFYEDRAPTVTVDFMLRVKPPMDSEIDLSKVRGFIQSLRDYGVPIWRITYDSFQSRGEVQTLRKLGFDAAVVSVDRDDDAYLSLKQAMTEGRVSYYPYECLTVELSELERDLDKRKVDHPHRSHDGNPGHKDVADSLAGAVWAALSDKRVVVPGGDPRAFAERGASLTVERRVSVPGGSLTWGDLDKELRR